jgi:hypothetical protein
MMWLTSKYLSSNFIIISILLLCFVLFCFLVGLEFDSELCTCKAGAQQWSHNFSPFAVVTLEVWILELFA